MGLSPQAPDGTAMAGAGHETAPPPRSERRENDRIAAELYDSVIRRLFSAGLSLHSAAAPLRTPTAPRSPSVTLDHIDDAIRMLDEAISVLRATIYSAPDRDQRRRPDPPPAPEIADAE